MKNYLKLLLLIPITIFGTIYEIKKIEEVKIPEQSNVLVIFDIDNTLIHLKQELGSDQWFYHRWKQLEKTGLTTEEALCRVAFEFNGIQSLSQCQLVEQTTPNFFAKLRSEKIPFMGLTIRSFELSKRTIQQLKSCNLKFDQKVFDPSPQFLDKNTFLFSYDGIVFTNGGSKGHAIGKWLDHFLYQVDHVVVIDDKLQHLEAIEKELERRGIEMTGYRYGYLDDHVANFCPNRARVQFELVEPLIEGKL